MGRFFAVDLSRAALVAFAVLADSPIVVTAQQTARVHYIKIADNPDDYVRVEGALLKSSALKMVKQGTLRSWSLYQPDGPSRNYDFAVLAIEGISGGLDDKSLTAIYSDPRAVVRREVWNLVDEVRPESQSSGVCSNSAHSTNESQMATVHYLRAKANGREDYLRMERNLWKPAHELLVRENKICSWWLYEVRSAVTNGNDFLTFTVYDESQRDFGKYEGSALMAVHPDKTLDSINRRTRDIRDTVGREIWKLVADCR